MVGLLNLGLQPGQKLRIRTKNEIVLGKFTRMSSDGKKLQVAEPQLLDGTKLGKKLWYFEKEIENINVGNLVMNAEVETPGILEDSKLFDPIISKAQSDRIQEMIYNAELINQSNMNYYAALKDISGSLFIGLYAENANFGRLFKAEFLQISTSNKLYVYDLRQLNTTALFNDLRPILENQAYLKIVFDSRLLFDNLKHHYNLKIAPVCDIALNTNREFKDLNHCVEEIFGIKMHNSEQKDERFWQRPVGHDQLVTLSSKVAYLIPLYAQINQLKLMENFKKDIEDYTSVTKDGLFKDIFSNNREKLREMIRKRHAGGAAEFSKQNDKRR